MCWQSPGASAVHFEAHRKMDTHPLLLLLEDIQTMAWENTITPNRKVLLIFVSKPVVLRINWVS